jgi:hypothetical protein
MNTQLLRFSTLTVHPPCPGHGFGRTGRTTRCSRRSIKPCTEAGFVSAGCVLERGGPLDPPAADAPIVRTDRFALGPNGAQ